jgi:hypothetical protein
MIGVAAVLPIASQQHEVFPDGFDEMEQWQATLDSNRTCTHNANSTYTWHLYVYKPTTKSRAIPSKIFILNI